MMPIDLKEAPAQELISAVSLEELLEAVSGIDEWEPRVAETLDYVYRHRLLRALRRQSGQKELEELADHVRRVLNVDRRPVLAALSPDFACRWDLLAELVDSHLSALGSRDEEGVLGRAHVRELLGFLVEREPRTQQQIRLRFQLKEANLTRVLNLMESHDLVERQWHGREKLVWLGSHRPAVAPSSKEPAARPGYRSKLSKRSAATPLFDVSKVS